VLLAVARRGVGRMEQVLLYVVRMKAKSRRTLAEVVRGCSVVALSRGSLKCNPTSRAVRRRQDKEQPTAITTALNIRPDRSPPIIVTQMTRPAFLLAPYLLGEFGV
jgi:hypothetical protein